MPEAPTGAGPGPWNVPPVSALRTSAMLLVTVTLADLLAPPELPVSVLHVMPVMISVWMRSRRALHTVALLAGVLTLAASVAPPGAPYLRFWIVGATLFILATTWHLCRTWLGLREDLEASQSMRRRTVQNLAEGVVTVAADGTVVMINPAAAAMTGWPVDEALGRHVDEVVRRERDVVLLPKDSVVTPGDGELLASRGGETMPVEVSEVQVDGERVLVLRDATAQRDREGAMLRLAYRDRLTGLSNRASLVERLDLELAHARRDKTLLALLFLDLDGLKRVNDTLGHQAGDALLVGVADRLREALREADTIARLGGDEFTVLLPRLEDADHAGAVADKLLEALATPVRHEGRDLVASASLGLALYPGDGADGPELLEHADAAMYRAKQAGGHGWRRWAAPHGSGHEPVEDAVDRSSAPDADDALSR